MVANPIEDIRCSAVLKYIRVLFMILIVFAHNSYTTNETLLSISNVEAFYPLYYQINVIVTGILSDIAVPGFFLISGFYLLKHDNRISWGGYEKILNKKYKTLFIPFLLWNSFYVLCFYVLPLIVPSIFRANHLFTWRVFLKSLWCLSDDGHAMNQLWYLRDLICLVLFSPLICYIFNRYKWSIFIPFVIYILGLTIPTEPYFFSGTSLFWFSLGCFFKIYMSNFVSSISGKYYICLLSIILIIVDLLSLGTSFNGYIHKCFVFSGVMASIIIVGFLYDRFSLGYLNNMVSATFFVYLVHLPWILYPVRMVLYRTIHPVTDIGQIFTYFLIVFIVIVICLLLFNILVRLFPRVMTVITGDRLTCSY